ncbi:GntR family transcriptional regulator [Allopusillimonas soli]|uniref:GntR family transcriptional regulator n=1 Tax=Allopusillimonas soli TaxID=659016 RepID=A0A853FBR7_9BURK|nr:GntR family transcriptional regulator [Allopusillimonas soli]NYT35991.1 GntR family transcriptional regulator [Allopusillimonas soli]TEA76335.1 GntR family transcriptional regulator [Allopusillimonas soli]
MTQPSEAFLDVLARRLAHYARPGLPKYMVLRDAVSGVIATGAIASGTRLPTESEWARQLPLSLGTIQRALRMLAEDGVVMRKQGDGTYVAGDESGTMHAPMHCRFLNDDASGYLPVYPKILSRYQAAEHGRWTPHLGCERSLCIERQLDIGHEFSIFSRFYIDPERVPTFSRLSLPRLASENFKEIIVRETAQTIGRINQFLVSATFDARMASVLNVRADSAGQCLIIFAYLGKENPIYYQELYIPPNNRVHHLSNDAREEAAFEY